MTNRERIFEAIGFIEANLKSDINVSDIAQKACCSLHHFIRLFLSITGSTPKKYLLHRRLTESAKDLRSSDRKIIDVALKYQFTSHEVFTRSFAKKFGINPSKVKKGGIIPTHLLTFPLTEAYIFQSSKARNQEPELVLAKSKWIVGFSYFISGDLKHLDLSKEWSAFMKMAPNVQHKSIPERFFQVQFWSENQENEGMHFFLGVEVNDISSISSNFVAKKIPAGSYLRFIHKGISRDVGFTYRYIYKEFLPNTDYKLSMPFNYEYYGSEYLSPDNEQSESYLCIPVEV